VLDPGNTSKRLEAGDDKIPHEQQKEIVAREDFIDLRHRSAPRAFARRQRGFLPAPPHHHVEDFNTSHRLAVIEPTARGIASIAAAYPRIATAGRAVVRDIKVLIAAILKGVHVTMRTRCDVLGLPLE
jgi:hypothetical protein